MLPEERGAGAAASGNGEFRAGPRRVKAPKVPGAARRLVLPRCANAQGAAGARRPPGKNLLFVPAARQASTVLCSRA
jgi:hypothetical protein